LGSRQVIFTQATRCATSYVRSHAASCYHQALDILVCSHLQLNSRSPKLIARSIISLEQDQWLFWKSKWVFLGQNGGNLASAAKLVANNFSKQDEMYSMMEFDVDTLDTDDNLLPMNATQNISLSAQGWWNKDEYWSAWYGDERELEGMKKVCTNGGFISKFTLNMGNHKRGQYGVSRIAQADCSDGTELQCCDGQSRSGDFTSVIRTQRGFSWIRGKYNHERLQQLCFHHRCIGDDGHFFELHCRRGYVVSGFQVRGNITVRAIRFICRRGGYHHWR